MPIFTDTLTFRIAKLATAHRIELERRLSAYGVHAGQILVLFELWEQDGLGQSELALRLGLSGATVNRMVRSLASNEFVEVRQSPDDGRVKLIYLTPAAVAVKPHIERCWNEMEASLKVVLSAAERMLLTELTDRMVYGARHRAFGFDWPPGQNARRRNLADMRVLLAIDSTSQSDAAIEFAGLLSLGDGDEIVVLTVIDMSPAHTFDRNTPPPATGVEIESVVRRHAAERLDEVVSRLQARFEGRSLTITGESATGSPDRRIVESAERLGVDLIVVGSHGYNKWERLLLGSVSDAVVHHAPCSVLVARSK